MATVLSNCGARVDLQIKKGSAFAETVTYKVNGGVTNISGYTFAAQIRTTSGALATSFTCTISDAPNGKFGFSLTSAQTASLNSSVQYKWDLEVTISGVTSELFRGDVYVVDEVTQ
jgi:uncharacterized protein YdeI (BOF family)